MREEAEVVAVGTQLMSVDKIIKSSSHTEGRGRYIYASQHKLLVIILAFTMTVLALAMTLLAGADLVGAVSELTVDDRLGITFPDLSEAGWAMADIDLLTIRGVFGGFPDGTFRPNAPIKKIEALVMAVRASGLEYDVANQAKIEDSNSFLINAMGLDWAAGYLRVGIKHKLITGILQESDWYAPADRLWTAKLMVRMLGQEVKAQNMDANLIFTDKDSIMKSQWAYVRLAQDAGLMQGYPDGTFRPAVPIIRSEMAVVFNNYFHKFMTDYSIMEMADARIESYDRATGEIVLRTYGSMTGQRAGMVTYRVNPRAMVYYIPYASSNVDGEKRSVASLRVGQTIDYVLSDQEELVYIKIKIDATGADNSGTGTASPGNNGYDYDAYDTRERHYVGFFDDFTVADRELVFENLAGKREKFTAEMNIEIRNLAGQLEDVKLGKLYRYYLRGSGADKKIYQMEEVEARRSSYTGDYLSYNAYNGKIMVRYDALDTRYFIVAEGVEIDMLANDQVRVYAYGDYIYDWDILRPAGTEGTFQSYDATRKTITIKDKAGKSQTYDLVKDPRLTIPNNYRAGLDKLVVGDYLKIGFDIYDMDGDGDRGQVYEITVINQLSGEVTRARSSGIRIVDDNKQTHDLDWASSVQVTIVGMTSPTVDDIRVGDTAYLTINGGKVSKVSVLYRSTIEGKVYQVKDLGSGKYELLLDAYGYLRQSYTIDGKTNIRWMRFSNLSATEIENDSQVKVWYDGDRAVEIEIIDTSPVKGLVIDSSYDSIWLRDGADSQSRYIVDDKISDLRSYHGDMVQLTFANGKVASIQRLPVQEQTYVVVNYNESQGKLWVRGPESKHTIYLLADELIVDGSRVYADKLGGKIKPQTWVRVQDIDGRAMKLDLSDVKRPDFLDDEWRWQEEGSSGSSGSASTGSGDSGLKFSFVSRESAASSANLYNMGLALGHGSVNYLAGEAGGLYIQARGKDKAYKLADGQPTYLNASGPWVYYVNQGANRVISRINAQAKSKLLSDSTAGYIYGYEAYNPNNQHYKSYDEYMTIQKEAEVKIISHDEAGQLLLHDGWLYYVSVSDNNRLYRIETDGTGKELVLDEAVHQFYIADGQLIYLTFGDYYGNYQAKLDGEKADRYWYESEDLIVGKLYSVGLKQAKTGQAQLLVDVDVMGMIVADDAWVHYLVPGDKKWSSRVSGRIPGVLYRVYAKNSFTDYYPMEVLADRLDVMNYYVTDDYILVQDNANRGRVWAQYGLDGVKVKDLDSKVIRKTLDIRDNEVLYNRTTFPVSYMNESGLGMHYYAGKESERIGEKIPFRNDNILKP